MTYHKTRSGICYGRIHKGGVILIVIRPQGETEDTGRAA